MHVIQKYVPLYLMYKCYFSSFIIKGAAFFVLHVIKNDKVRKSFLINNYYNYIEFYLLIVV